MLTVVVEVGWQGLFWTPMKESIKKYWDKWSEWQEEVKGMGYNMKTAIRKTLQDKKILEDRTTRLRYTAKRHFCRD